MTPASSPHEGILVSGEATRRASPDTAELILNLQTLGATAAQALRDNAAHVQRLGPGLDTVSLTITPISTPAPQGPQAQAPYGIVYQVTNTLRLVLRDMAQVASVLEAVAGVAQLSCAIVFKTNDESRLRHELLEAAVRDARAKAEVLACAAGRHVSDVILLAEDVSQSSNPSTPGDLTFRARVLANFRLSCRGEHPS
jgi:uncharacterized protein YggE